MGRKENEKDYKLGKVGDEPLSIQTLSSRFIIWPEKKKWILTDGGRATSFCLSLSRVWPIQAQENGSFKHLSKWLIQASSLWQGCSFL